MRDILFHKQIQLKNKYLEFEINDSGWFTFATKFKREKEKDHATTSLKIEIFGIEFAFYIIDTRHYNETEKRFYLSDEPEHYFYNNKNKYIKEVKEFMQNNKNIDPLYIIRALKTWDSWEDENEKFNAKQLEDYSKYNAKMKKIMKTIPWENTAKCIDYDGDKYKAHYDNGNIILTGLRTRLTLCLEDAIWMYDIYDANGKLLSKRYNYGD